MAHPKRRHSTTRRDKRRTTYKAVAPTISSCSNCSATVQLHRVCGECGYYKGKQAIEKTVAA
jgi:large subunit ribosomal protein L32